MSDGLRLFLSYGHDGNAPLVTRISRGLEERGHDVWIDQTSMKVGEHWRRTILNGIQDSSGVVAFLSKHSTRDPGACLDELRIAVSLPGVSIATVLMEPEQEVKPPGIVAEIQWLDLSGWRDEQAKGEESFEAWYAERFERLCAALESPETKAFVGEITELREKLRPIVLDQKERELLDSPYVGREWLRDALEDWRVNKPESKAFVVLGTPGAGKSAFAVRTLWDDPYAVCGILIEWDKAVTNDPRQIIRMMAFKLAARLPDYRKLLIDTLRDLRRLDDAGVAELFAWLITQPLSYCSGTDRERVYIVLDALDEAPDDNLARVLARNLRLLPKWIGLLIMSRPEQELRRLFDEYNPVELDAHNEMNTADIEGYLRCEFNGADVEVPDQSLRDLAENAGGSFWWARLVAQEVVSHGLDVLTLGIRGLGDLYSLWFERAFPTGSEWIAGRSYLELMLADEALPVELLTRIGGSDRYSYQSFRRSIGSLVQERPVADSPGNHTPGPNALAFCHKSIADWLGDESSGEYFVDCVEGHRRLAEVAYQVVVLNQSIGADTELAKRWLGLRAAEHMVRAGLWQEYAELLLKVGPESIEELPWQGDLWEHVDEFPLDWDMSGIYSVLETLWKDYCISPMGLHVCHPWSWDRIFRVFEKNMRTQRMALELIRILESSRFRLGGFFRSGASGDIDRGIYLDWRERTTGTLALALRCCVSLGVVVPDQVCSYFRQMAHNAATDVYRGHPGHPLSTDLDVYAFGEFSVDDLNEWERGFNRRACYYELFVADRPDTRRLRALATASQISPEELAAQSVESTPVRIFLDCERADSVVNRVLPAVRSILLGDGLRLVNWSSPEDLGDSWFETSRRQLSEAEAYIFLTSSEVVLRTLQSEIKWVLHDSGKPGLFVVVGAAPASPLEHSFLSIPDISYLKETLAEQMPQLVKQVHAIRMPVYVERLRTVLTSESRTPDLRTP